MNIRIASERLNTLETLHHARQQNWRYLLDVPNGAGRTRQFEEAVIALGLWPGGSVRPTGQRAVDLRMARYSEHDQIEHISRRSEEHTSELQSLMRIPYAVFCL